METLKPAQRIGDKPQGQGTAKGYDGLGQRVATVTAYKDEGSNKEVRNDVVGATHFFTKHTRESDNLTVRTPYIRVVFETMPDH